MFFTTLRAQLAVKIPGLGLYIDQAVDADPHIAMKLLKEQFDKLIFHPLSKISSHSTQPRNVVIVVDALDECERERDVRTILSLLAKTRDAKSLRLRVFVTSRPELPIRFGFGDMTRGTYHDLILQNIPQPTIEHDLSIYLEHELERIRLERSLSIDWPGKANVQALVKMAIPALHLRCYRVSICGRSKVGPEEAPGHHLTLPSKPGVEA